jgi:hypothetical protein
VKRAAAPLALVTCLAACAAPGEPLEVQPGAALGPLRLGMRFAELEPEWGAMPDALVDNRFAIGGYPERGLEVILTSPEDRVLGPEARVVALGVRTGAKAPPLSGTPRLGQPRAEIEAALGPAPDRAGDVHYWPAGVSVIFDGSDRAQAIGLYAPYTRAPAPPEMAAPAGTPRPPPAPEPPTGVEVNGRRLEVIDLHLHPGHFGAMPPEGRAFLVGAAPGPVQLYAPGVFEPLLDPFAPHVGIREQTRMAGIDHAVLLAVYTHHTSGYLANQELEALLDDPRNRGWAWGMPSINFFDGYEQPGVAEARLAALRACLVGRPDLFIGIKLAHAHQAVPLDDARSLQVYDLAAERGVPVLLHTGFSPFPGSRREPGYYSPSALAQVVGAYDGTKGRGRVDFILSHVGQGDPRAVAAALALAEAHDNVWLELSALNRPLLLDEDGQPVERSEPQYPGVLTEVKRRGLTARTLFASDGPQFSGMVRGYLRRLVDGMRDAGYSTDEIAAVLAGNFRRVFRR